MTGSRSPHRNVLIALASGIGVTLCWFLLTWHYGFDLADEGYYWYGSQRVLRGEVPIRDFLAYDIGRYLWAAAIMFVMGDEGIFGAHSAAFVYQALSVCVGTWLALWALQARLGTARTIGFAVAVALILNLWATPYYKVYDYGTCILIVAMTVLILTSRSPARWFGAGVILGLAAVMGRNHGVYGAASALLALGFVLLKQGNRHAVLRPALAFIGGTILGFSPTFLMELAKPGFLDALAAGVIEHVHSVAGATNIPLPVPWPWTAEHGKNGWVLWACDVAKGVGFIALLLVPVLALLAMLRKRIAGFTELHYLLTASAFVGLVYAHYAYSRADLVHLALAVVPVLLILFCCSMLGRAVLPVAIGVLGFSVLAVGQDVMIINSKLFGRTMKTVVIDGSTLHTDPFIVDHILASRRALATVPGAQANFLAVPNLPGLYAINRSRMGIWEIYALSHRDAGFEQAELARLAKLPPKMVLLSNHALDNQPQMRYSAIHPVTYKWIVDNYEREKRAPMSDLEVYVRKGSLAAQ
ncbi:hypothetical protein FBX97_0098 [Herbaspirillum sp. SJZ107]|nr:hypothetical protein FBX97_0098 [Herbaspirillum sp. SJZ107]